MSKLPVCQSLITVDNIENDFVLYTYAAYGVTVYLCKDQQIFNKQIRFCLMEQVKLLAKHKLSIQEVILAFKFADSDIIPQKFKPKVQELSMKRILDHKYVRNIKKRINNINKIPEKRRTTKKVSGLYRYESNIKKIDNMKFYKLIFKKSIISLMVQRKWEPKISNFFIEYTKVVGISFDQYIEDWAKRLANEP